VSLEDGERRRFETDAAGDFEARLPEGTYRLVAVEHGAGVILADALPVNVLAGQTVSVTLEAQPDWGDEVRRVGGSMGPETGVSFENGPGGVAVSFVMHDSPAYAAGVREGDLVLSLDGAPVTSALDAFPRARGHDGQDVPWAVRRDGQDQRFTVPAR
jgi:S1-C subfamily serine protease